MRKVNKQQKELANCPALQYVIKIKIKTIV
jgi:hypothetical protein